MENAGAGIAHIVSRYTTPGENIMVICGPGNNGGDGLVAARHLRNRGYQVHVLLTAPVEKYRGVSAGQLAIAQAMELPIATIASEEAALAKWLATTAESGCIVDAIFGTGLSRPVQGEVEKLIHALNAAERLVVSVDIPSGLDCDRGEPLGAAIRAGHTVSFCGMKIGFAQASAPAFTGQISIADIGAPRALLCELAIAAPQ